MPGKQPIISEPGITSCRCDRDLDRGWARTALTSFYGRSLQTRRRREQVSAQPSTSNLAFLWEIVVPGSVFAKGVLWPRGMVHAPYHR
ncbi:hypothetical protein MRX96_049130 [Rhipicephalus microplus]